MVEARVAILQQYTATTRDFETLLLPSKKSKEMVETLVESVERSTELAAVDDELRAKNQTLIERLERVQAAEHEGKRKIKEMENANRKLRERVERVRITDQSRLTTRKSEKRPSSEPQELNGPRPKRRRGAQFTSGWKRDYEKVGSGTIWGTPGKRVRASIIEALAYEIGDVNNLEEIIQEEVGSDFLDQVSPLKE
ncbi:hypothetical protein H2201_000047 [Coniosporium apollinis]|uniref:Myotonic dystrophy protein kinase coiled coil domain-containing protein n=1 Tax=Coniosporium apollinis TaxID=61459 RepID=A0ABQ9P6G2_9PEZI|nr:hypothetical protein H2201_000047 [Coniosporium apollinis]